MTEEQVNQATVELASVVGTFALMPEGTEVQESDFAKDMKYGAHVLDVLVRNGLVVVKDGLVSVTPSGRTLGDQCNVARRLTREELGLDARG